ncbi:MAG: LysM peptidoglycan-binding domain-containing protein [Nitrososphaerales archaeon]
MKKVNRLFFAIIPAALLLFLAPAHLGATVSSASQVSMTPYTVQSGDSLYSIGQRFGVDWQTIATTNGISPPYTIYSGEVLQVPIIVSTTPTSCNGDWYYTVQYGDSIGRIGSYFGIAPIGIELLNNMQSPYWIFPGEKLAIPDCNTAIGSVGYTVQPGDSLSAIGQEFSTQWQGIAEANSIQSPYMIYLGEHLLLPGASFAPSSSAPISTINRGTWLWVWGNYNDEVNQLALHPGSVTVVSPAAFALDNSGTFQISSEQAVEMCSQVQSMHVGCDPMIQNDQYSPDGINALLTNPGLQSSFISAAVSEAVSAGLGGYNVDFEPAAGTWQVAWPYGTFLTNFANAMHSVGKVLSVDVASWDGGVLWNYWIEGQSSVDIVLTMDTYSGSMTFFNQSLQTALWSIPLDKLAVGFQVGPDDSTLSQRFQSIENAGVQNVMVWPSSQGYLSDMYWSPLTNYLVSSG